MAGKTKSQKKKALDMRSKMYLVLALCSVMLLVSVGISLVLIGGIDLGGADAQSVSTVDSASMVVESGYDKEENTIDTQAYTSTILEQSADAGDSYVDETGKKYHLPVLAKMPLNPEFAKEADAGMIETFAGDYLDGAADAVAKLLK